MGRSHSIVSRPYVHILGPKSGGKVPEYSTGFLCIYSWPYVIGNVPMSGGKVPANSTWVPMHIARALWQTGRYQSIVLGPYLYIRGPMSGGKVPEYSTGVLCIYAASYIRWEGPNVLGPMYIYWSLCEVGSSQSIVLGSYVYI